MKKKTPLSFKRIFLVLAGFFALPLVLLFGDSILESRNNYCDLEPLWIHDGREFVFVRWHWQKGPSRNLMELYTADSDGNGERLLYSFEPGFHVYGLRFLQVARDEHGRKIKLRADGLLARVIQHEVDHLNGKLFIDKLSKKV